MRKVLWELPGLGLTVSSFGLALAVACCAAFHLALWRARRERIAPESVYGLGLWLIAGGFIGARLFYIATHPDSVHSAADVFRIWQGGIVYYGCLLGGLIGSCLYWARRPFPFLAMADAVAPALCLGSALGRLGCFLNGCCFGARCDLPWAVRFPAGSAPWAHHVREGWAALADRHSLPVHPTQLYSALDGLLLLALLTAFYPRRRRDGQVMALLMLTYPLARFLVESFRDDERQVLLGMTMAQVISLATFAAGLALWTHLARSPAHRHADGTPEAPFVSPTRRAA